MAEIGSTLREARMRARIDISEVESNTKIRAKYLRAIENEEWDLLPGTIYVKSFLKTYGDYLGLDSRLLVDEFKRRYESPGDHERPLAAITRDRERSSPNKRSGSGARNNNGPRSTSPPRRRLRFGPEALLVLVIIAIVVALFVIHNHHKDGPSSGAITPAGSEHKHKPSAGKTGEGAEKVTTNQKSPTPTQATLALVPTGAVWLCVEGPNHKVLVHGQTYEPGSQVPIARASELLVSLGNSNVTATVNGKAYSVKPSASAIAFKVTPTGAHALANGPTCT